ncbi:MAG: (4Fe-4S)-binding protein [Candidatus Nitrotoga sp.]
MKIQWDKQKCSHSGSCVKSLPEVFKVVDGQFVFEPDKAAYDEVVNVVNQCPSGALKLID